MSHAAELATFAARFSLSPSQAVVLPALFEKAAEKTGREVRALISQATFSNQELGEYLAEVAQTVARQMEAEL